MFKIYKMVITGGPCAGKSKVIEKMAKNFDDNVVIVPEIAAQLLEIPYKKGGLGVPGRDLEWSQAWQDKFQESVIKKQISDESYYLNMVVKRNTPVVMICDRGILDGAAYLKNKEEFLNKFKLKEKECLERYDVIIHFDTLAKSNPMLYEQIKKKDSNRFESAERAIELNEKAILAWNGHKSFAHLTTDNLEEKYNKCAGKVIAWLKYSKAKLPIDKNTQYAAEMAAAAQQIEKRFDIQGKIDRSIG